MLRCRVLRADKVRGASSGVRGMRARGGAAAQMQRRACAMPRMSFDYFYAFAVTFHAAAAHTCLRR